MARVARRCAQPGGSTDERVLDVRCGVACRPPRTQCTRKCLPGQSFCGTHLKKHVEGRLGPDDVVTSSGTLDGAAPGDASGGATEDATTVEDALLCQIADEIGDEEGAEERE